MSYLWWNFEDISFCDVKELPRDCASVVNNQGYLITKDVFKIPIGINLKIY